MLPTVGLFVPCFVDLFRPSLAEATARLLNKCGFRVMLGGHGNCCGRTALEAGDAEAAANFAKDLIYDFYDCDYVVTPSTACAAMVYQQYPRLFPYTFSGGHDIGYNYHHFDKSEDLPHRAELFRSKFYEITDFLYRIAQFVPDNISATMAGKKIIYHESCAARSMTDQAARGLLSQVGMPILLPPDHESCCGFGGYFTTDFPDLSATITDKKCRHILSADPDVLLSTDLDCLIHLVGRLDRTKSKTIAAYHVIEFLTGDALHNIKPIGT